MRRRLPRLRIPLGEPGTRRGLRAGRHHLRRPQRCSAGTHRQQGPRHRSRPGCRFARAGVVGAVGIGRRPGGSRRRHGVPAVRQGRVGRRRAWHAPGGRSRRAARSGGGRQPGSRIGLRRPDGLSRAGGAQPPPHRGADPGRRRRQRDASVRAGLQRATPPPEGDRAGPGAQPVGGTAHQDLPGRRGVRPPDRLHLRRHGRIPARRARAPRVHRMQSADPGGAHRHRGDHRRRPGLQPATAGIGGDAGGSGPVPGGDADPRGGHAVPDHHRGPHERLPSRHRPDHRLPLTGRRRYPPGRRGGTRRRDRRPLRLDAGQTHLPGPRLRHGGRAGPPRAGRVPHPRGLDEHPVPAGRHRRPRLPGRAGDHVVHRRTALPADGALPGRPRHQDPELPGRRDRQPAARTAAVDGLPARQAAPDRSGRDAAAGQQTPADRGRSRGVRALDAGIQGDRGDRHDVPGCAPVAAGHPGAYVGAADGRALHRADDAATAVDRVLGRGDLRRRAAVPQRRPVGALGRAARSRAQHLSADAAARTQHRRLHALSGIGDPRLRAGGHGDGHRHLPDLRCTQQRRLDATGDRCGA